MAQVENRPATAKDTAPTNPRGIPFAPFVDNVEDYVSTRADVEGALRSFQEMISDKIPDIQKTLDTVRYLQSRKPDSDPLEATFELNDTLFAKAHIERTDEVYLWLGANVMLSYPLEEAETLLEGKLGAARSSLTACEEDLDFLREQITTMEVATARVYNWDVGQRRKEKEDAAREGAGVGGSGASDRTGKGGPEG